MADCWIIGDSPGSIGEALHQTLSGMGKEVVGTDKEEVDVRSRFDIDEFNKANGPFENVIYCAGIPSIQWIQDIGKEMFGEDNRVIGVWPEFEEVFNVNVLGFIRTMASLTNWQERGNVLALVSDAATHPMRASIAYCSSKAALDMAVRVAARELAPHWRVNGLSTSIVEDTNMTEKVDELVMAHRHWTEAEMRDYEKLLQPMRRRMTKQEVVKAALYILFGPEFQNGSVVQVTGGK